MSTNLTSEQSCEESTLTLSSAIDLVAQVYKKIVSKDTNEALDGSTLTGQVLHQAIGQQLRKSIGVL
jgi:hypothetical protein